MRNIKIIVSFYVILGSIFLVYRYPLFVLSLRLKTYTVLSGYFQNDDVNFSSLRYQKNEGLFMGRSTDLAYPRIMRIIFYVNIGSPLLFYA